METILLHIRKLRVDWLMFGGYSVSIWGLPRQHLIGNGETRTPSSIEKEK